MKIEGDKRLYFNNLDATRFFAFVIVFLAHCFVINEDAFRTSPLFEGIYNWGKVGVLGLEYFFVLSSFLISYIILEERSQTGKFHLFNFLTRRSLRVWPLYFFIILLAYLATSIAGFYHISHSPLPPWPWLFLFAVNYYMIAHGSEFLFFIAILWSISVEEQFYILWSLFMRFVRIRFTYFCGLLIAVSLIFRFAYLQQSQMIYLNTLSTLGNFGVGGLLAYGMRSENEVVLRIKSLPRSTVKFIYFTILLTVIFYHSLHSFQLFYLFERLFYSLLFAFIIIDQSIGENRIFNAGKLKVFNYLGKISYGLYCYHGICVTVLIVVLRYIDFPPSLPLVIFGFPLLIFLATVLISHVSYRYFEGFFLSMKSRFYTFKP